MPNKHIPLNRTFTKLPQYNESNVNDIAQNFDGESIWEGSETSSIGWAELLQLEQDKIVILAEAGTGKTNELEQLASHLQEQGNPSFFIRLELLLEPDFKIQDCLNTQQQSSFNSWHNEPNSETVAYFFIDSVDEAKLQNHRALEITLSRFVSSLSDEKLNNAKVFLTSRFSEWRVESDFKIFKERLITTSTNTEKEEPSFVYKLNPLNKEQIQIFAKEYAVRDPLLFVKQIEQADALTYAQRPQDLIDLIVYWQDHNEQLPERHIDLMQFNIEKKLLEVDESRAQQTTLSKEEAHLGAELIAAATTLCKKNTIRLAETEEDISIRQSSINPSLVIPRNWKPEKLNALIMRPVFDPEIYGTIRFHHRSTREFLTAQWLHSLLSFHPLARRETNKLLFSTKYGYQGIIPSMQPIAAWLACWDKKIRNKILKIAPEVLVENGDPSVFDVTFRITLLESLVSKYQHRSRTDLKVKPHVLKRLASDEEKMITVLCKRLKVHANDEDLSKLFLETVRQGPLTDCTPTVLELAEDTNIGEVVRVVAMRVILEIGSQAEQEQLINSLFNQGATGRKMLSWDCGKLFPRKLTVQQLLSIIRDAPQEEKYSTPHLSYQLDVLIKSIESYGSEEIIELIRPLHEPVKQAPHLNYLECKISRDYAWTVEYLIALSNVLIERRDNNSFSTAVLESFWMILTLKKNSYQFSYKRNENILEPGKEWRELSYQLIQYIPRTIKSDIAPAYQCNLILGSMRVFWSPRPSDWNPLIEILNGDSNQVGKNIALKSLYKIHCENNYSSEKLAELRGPITDDEELTHILESWLNPTEITRPAYEIEFEQAQIEREELSRQEEATRAEQHRIGVERLQAASDSLKNLYDPSKDTLHSDINYLYSVVKHQSDNNSFIRGLKDWEALIPEHGRQVAESFRDGSLKLWRDFDPSTLANWRTKDYLIINYGLSGLAMEASHNPAWLSSLTEEEAQRAALYATCEINQYPEWFASLQQTFPVLVNPILLDAARDELSGNSEFPNNISRFTNSNLSYLDELVIGLTELLQTVEERPNERAIQGALEVILQYEPDSALQTNIKQNLSNFTTRLFKLNQGDINKLYLLHALFAVDASQAITLVNEFISQHKNDPKKCEEWAVNVFAQFNAGRHTSIYTRYYQDYTRIEILEELVPLAYRLIKKENDIVRSAGRYTPTNRDNAQSVRFSLIDKVATTSGQKSYDLLMKWSNDPLFSSYKDWLLDQAKKRAENDSEFDPWQEQQVLDFTEKHHKYRNSILHKMIKVIFDHPRTSIIVAILSLAAAIWPIINPSSESSPALSNTVIFNGNVTNSPVNQNNHSGTPFDKTKSTPEKPEKK